MRRTINGKHVKIGIGLRSRFWEIYLVQVESSIPTATLLVGYCRQEQTQKTEFDALADRLAQELGQSVVACALDDSERVLLHAITGLLQQGIVRIVIVPLLISPAEFQGNVLSDAVVFAGQRWPYIHFHISPLLSWSEWLQAIGKHDDESTVILVGEGSSNAEINSDLSKLGRLLFEVSASPRVDVAFVQETAPTLGEMLVRHQRLGTQQITIVPAMLFQGTAYQHLTSQIETTQFQGALRLKPVLSQTDALLEVLQNRYEATLEDRSLLPVSWEKLQWELIAEMEAEHKQRPGQDAADEAAFQQMLTKIDQILPLRSNPDDQPSVRTELVVDANGAVRWDQLNPLGDLALSGGKSYRGDLLEAVDPAECLAEPERYAEVVAEIGTGIHTITGLSIVESNVPGWVGIQCDGEEMAIWLVRAIIVENIMVRREADVLYVPAGPQFTLKEEILSIVTVVSKTWRHWIMHQWQASGEQASSL